MIYNAEPHQLCIDFFTCISPFTQESVSLPYHDEFDQKQTEFATFNKFQEEMTKSEKWSSLSGIYMDLLDEIARGNYYKRLE